MPTKGWGVNMRAEFLKLREYGEEVVLNHRGNVVMLPEYLTLIRNHIELCDHIANTPKEIYTLFAVHYHWKKCHEFWSKYKPLTETVEVPDLILKTKKRIGPEVKEPSQTKALVRTKQLSKDPEKPWKVTANDIRFLRSLRIATDKSPDSNDEEDGT
ncbi:MAG: hypothetical protein Q8R55_00605 [Candidatus Taylorbacteria bacterium]|nr:hypothetical protein [Candidatus Taylorbacteria bacterium]